MTVVVGTAGHIDHGKTSLLRALTGIDADRLPEERRRGMTIDVGYAHLTLPDGGTLDFVDVPGHDRLVGNMLVGAGEIDAALLVVAADDGPRAQTLEHLALLDALRVRDGLAVVTKADLVEPERAEAVAAEVRAILELTTLADASVVVASAERGDGLEEVRERLVALAARVGDRIEPLSRPAAGEAEVRVAPEPSTRAPEPSTGAPVPRLAIDRVFTIRGHGTVVTGSLRGGPLGAGATVRIEPGGLVARVRQIQVHGQLLRGEAVRGRTALNLVGVEAGGLHRGQVVTAGPGVEISDRILVALTPGVRLPAAAAGEPWPPPRGEPWPPPHGTPARLHLGTAQVGARIGGRGLEHQRLADGRPTAILRLDEAVAAAIGDRFVLRRPSPAAVVAGGVILDPQPPAGPARKRANAERLGALASAVEAGDGHAIAAALGELHGGVTRERVGAVAGIVGFPRVQAGPNARLNGSPGTAGALRVEADLVAADVAEAVEQRALSLVARHHVDHPLGAGPSTATLEVALAAEARRRSDLDAGGAARAAKAIVESLVGRGRLLAAAGRVRDPGHRSGLPADALEAMDRLEALLSVPAPPPLSEAARQAACPPDGVRALEAAGRVVRLDGDLAYATGTWQRLVGEALTMARRGPLSPAAFRDATGTSRRYVVPILEDLDRRGILRRTPSGHVPGPRAPVPAEEPA